MDKSNGTTISDEIIDSSVGGGRGWKAGCSAKTSLKAGVKAKCSYENQKRGQQ